jgi:hypothetical protein
MMVRDFRSRRKSEEVSPDLKWIQTVDWESHTIAFRYGTSKCLFGNVLRYRSKDHVMYSN